MFGFLKRKGVTERALEEALQRAVRLFKAGDLVGAEREVHALVEQAAAEGTDSAIYARALFNESTVLCGIGDLNRAAAACREAALVPAKDNQGRKDRLTYLMNLGEVLTRLDRLDEAEDILRSSLGERKSLYGEDHPGYAYGLGSLADLLLARGRPGEALALVDKALAIYAPVGHQQFPSDFALRMFVAVAAQGAEADPLFGWAELPARVRHEVVAQVFDRADRSDPALSVSVLKALRDRLRQDGPDATSDLLNACVALTNAAKRAGDAQTQVEGAEEAVTILRAAGENALLPNMLEGLALALGDAGRSEDAERAYEEAARAAESCGDRRGLASALRNQAIWMDERGDEERAASLHQRAVAEAERCSDPKMLGRCACAYGIFLQHHGQLDAARPLLERSVSLLPADEPDAFCAQDHLSALQRGESCGCGDGGDETLSTLVERMVMDRAPAGTLKGLRVRLEAGIAVDVEAARPLTDAETVELNRVINVTIVEMQQKYRRAGYDR